MTCAGRPHSTFHVEQRSGPRQTDHTALSPGFPLDYSGHKLRHHHENGRGQSAVYCIIIHSLYVPFLTIFPTRRATCEDRDLVGLFAPMVTGT